MKKRLSRLGPAALASALTLCAATGTRAQTPSPSPSLATPSSTSATPSSTPATSTPSSSSTASLEQLLAYDAPPTPDVRLVRAEHADGVTVEDVTFASVAGGPPVEAYVVRPTNATVPLAAVLFVHWFAPPDPTSNRTQYLEEARALARRGTVSLLVSTFWSTEARYHARRWQDDFQNSVNQAKDLRRALDVLLSRPGVDPRRVALVGHDYGAMFGALVGAVDARPKAYVLIAGAGRFSDWYLFGSSSGVPQGEERESFRARLAQIDPVSVVGRVKADIFFQYGESDRYTPREDFVALYMAAPAPKRIATYASGHAMTADIIRHDRHAWLAEQLGLPPAAPPPLR